MRFAVADGTVALKALPVQVFQEITLHLSNYRGIS